MSQNVMFGEKYNDDNVEDTIDTSNYTIVDADHLDEDDIIPDQRYCLLSFMSPEGIMNCNVRSIKFRGAFPTLEAAEKYAATLEKKDKYFKIFLGESGKWLPCDPDTDKVEMEKSSDPEHQKIIDAQAKQRMAKMNELAGRTKQMIDKKTKGRKDMIDEKKKDGAAQELIDKKRQKNAQTVYTNDNNHGSKKIEDIKERMRNKLANKHNKKRLENLNTSNNTELDTKIKVVAKKSADIADSKTKLETVDKNIERIKELMANRKKN